MFAIINGTRYNLEYYEDVLEDRLSVGTAYIVYRNGEEFILPCVTDRNEIGIYDAYPFRKINFPPEGDDSYSASTVVKCSNDGGVLMEIVNPESMLIDSDQVDMIRCEGADIFAPPINDNDNIFNRMIKTVLAEKQLPIDAYKFSSMIEKNNLKRGLQNQSNMTADRFFQWCQILGIRNHHELSDDPSSRTPINKVLTFEY